MHFISFLLDAHFVETNIFLINCFLKKDLLCFTFMLTMGLLNLILLNPCPCLALRHVAPLISDGPHA